MLTVAITAAGDDSREDRNADTLNGYTSESNYDYSNVQTDSGGDNNNLLVRFNNITVAASVSSATLRLYCTQTPGNATSYAVYADVGANRQAAWSNSSRYETGFTTSTATGSFSQADLTASAWVEVDVTSVVNECIALGGWSSGDTIRMAVVALGSVSGDPARFAQYWYTATPDHDFAPELIITAGSSDPEGGLVGGKLTNGGILIRGRLV